MSCNLIYMNGGKKMVRPVNNREEYLALRDSDKQKLNVAVARSANSTESAVNTAKRNLVQMNYSCIPNETGFLRGSKEPSNTVGMDVDFDKQAPDYAEKMAAAPDLILSKKEELGLLMLERSATKGYHLVFKRHSELSNEQNLKWASGLLGVEYDKGAKDITRVFYSTTGSAEDLLFLSDELFSRSPALCATSPKGEDSPVGIPPLGFLSSDNGGTEGGSLPEGQRGAEGHYLGIPYSTIIAKWWELYNYGQEPVKSNRNTLTYELAVNLRNICGFDRELLNSVIPCYDGFTEEEKLSCIDSALSANKTQMPKRLNDVLFACRQDQQKPQEDTAMVFEEDDLPSGGNVPSTESSPILPLTPSLPQGISDSIEAVGPALAMPVLIAICPAIGALATGVELDVHGKSKNLNLISYIAGDFASGKGSIDPVVDAWMSETKALDKMYQEQEDEWRARKRAAKNKKEQPEEPKLPVRCLTLNNTVANLAERLANTEGKHAFSFTPEADTVAQKWKSTMSDFSVMLRQSYDGTGYEREARSAEAVNVHIDKLLWNVTMCGTPDALYRVVNNYTDGFQSRVAIARTPDNTYTPLEDANYVLTDLQCEKIHQVAHLLPLMCGAVVLPKLEQKGREWVENVRLEAMKDDDKIMARQRFRVCVTAQRMVCCLMLCQVCDSLISKYGLNGAEKKLKMNPLLWKELLQDAQTPELLAAYDLIADYLLDSALFFFRNRIEDAFNSKNYAGAAWDMRTKRGKNDSIFERLDVQFTFEQAMQHSVAVKGANVSRNAVQMMLKNWRKQGLIVADQGRYRKS